MTDVPEVWLRGPIDGITPLLQPAAYAIQQVGEDFLPIVKVAEIYADGPKANWVDNPMPVAITRRAVTSTTRLCVVMAPGGGQAIRIRPAKWSR